MDWNKFYDFEQKQLNKLSKVKFVLGVIDESPKRKKSKKEIKDSGITNAELLIIHEFGSPARKIPKRPILDLTISRSEEVISDTLDKCISLIVMQGKSFEEIEIYLKQCSMKIESIARKAIYSGDAGFAKLKSSTIKQKKSDLPLFDTGQLARSIMCKYIK